MQSIWKRNIYNWSKKKRRKIIHLKYWSADMLTTFLQAGKSWSLSNVSCMLIVYLVRTVNDQEAKAGPAHTVHPHIGHMESNHQPECSFCLICSTKLNGQSFCICFMFLLTAFYYFCFLKVRHCKWTRLILVLKGEVSKIYVLISKLVRVF